MHSVECIAHDLKKMKLNNDKGKKQLIHANQRNKHAEEGNHIIFILKRGQTVQK